MGKVHSKEELMSKMFRASQESSLIPDIGIDDSLMKYSGLNSAAVLTDYSSELLRDLGSKVPDYLTSLGAALSAFKCIPNAVGLGALIIGFMLDLTIISLTKEDNDNTLNMMRRVFGEEKASGVRDSMDEYMKRLSMFMNEPRKALEETERLEKGLSEQLTRLRNSMLHDDQMSTRSMKHWTNGAAFHVQMLIHAARLKMAVNDSSSETDLQPCVTSVGAVVGWYQKDLLELLEKYRSYKSSTISTTMEIRPPVLQTVGYAVPSTYIVRDSETGANAIYEKTSRFLPMVPSDVYIDYMFKNWSQIEELKKYFTDLEENLRELILQRDDFSMVVQHTAN
ncbi:hypothetical protein NFI96_004472 [Prochilodus magdalenae]|nr:hypothetical protein NFI96_004472 [Prochilodus magdalenae]